MIICDDAIFLPWTPSFNKLNDLSPLQVFNQVKSKNVYETGLVQ